MPNAEPTILPDVCDTMMSLDWAICQIQKRGVEGEVDDLKMRKREKVLCSLECNFYEGKTLLFVFYLLLYIQFLVKYLAQNRYLINILLNE